jgi:hypothetical protein
MFVYFFRFITLADMSEMLSTSDGKMDSTILKMWHDGLKEIRCKGTDKITFDEFQRFLKGQSPQEAMIQSIKKDGSSRRISRNMIHSSFALQPVPEGTPSKASGSSDNTLTWRSSHFKPQRRSRTQRASSLCLSPVQPMVDDDDEIPPYDATFDPGYLESEAYRKRQEFRSSILEASRLFDQMRTARQPIRADNPAGLTMVAGGRRPSGGESLAEKEQAARVAAACCRGGRRNRRNKKKTKSDLSEFLS